MKLLMFITIISTNLCFARSGDIVRPYELEWQHSQIETLKERKPNNIEVDQSIHKDTPDHDKDIQTISGNEGSGDK